MSKFLFSCSQCSRHQATQGEWTRPSFSVGPSRACIPVGAIDQELVNEIIAESQLRSMLRWRLTECSWCVIWAGGGGGEAPPFLLDFFSAFSVSKLRSQRRAESGWREGQSENFLAANTLCHLILNDWIVSPSGSNGKESACNAGDLGSIPGSGRFPGERNDYLLHHSRLENSRNRGTWWATVQGVAKSWTWLNN